MIYSSDILVKICEFINMPDVINLLKVNKNTNRIRGKNIFRYHTFKYSYNLHKRILIDELKNKKTNYIRGIFNLFTKYI